MKASYDVQIPEREYTSPRKRKCKEYYQITRFLKTDHKNLCLEYKNSREAGNRIQAMKYMAAKENLNVSFMKRNNMVFVTRKE